MLKQLREAQGLWQRDLTAKVKVTGAYIAQLGTSVRANPTIDTMKRLAKALKMPVGELLE